MPVLKTKTHAKRRTARRRAIARRTNPSAAAPAYIYRNKRPTHVVLAVNEYHRLLDAAEARELSAMLDDKNTQWIKAEDAALDIAASWIARARKAAGLTQQQLARKLGVPQSQISRVERNPDRTTMRTARRIAAALGVDISALLSVALPKK